jgi:hypothetical protein
MRFYVAMDGWVVHVLRIVLNAPDRLEGLGVG